MRQVVIDDGMGGANDFVGTPETVAELMARVMDEVGGDGFLITSPEMRLNRRYVTEITDGLVPELQRRGLVRTEYDHRPVPRQSAGVLAGSMTSSDCSGRCASRRTR